MKAIRHCQRLTFDEHISLFSWSQVTAAAQNQAPASLTAEWSLGGHAGAVLLQDDKPYAFFAPVGDSSRRPGAVVEGKSILGQFADNFFRLAQLLMQLFIPVHFTPLWLLQEVPERLHEGGSGQEGRQLFDEPKPRPHIGNVGLTGHGELFHS